MSYYLIVRLPYDLSMLNFFFLIIVLIKRKQRTKFILILYPGGSVRTGFDQRTREMVVA